MNIECYAACKASPMTPAVSIVMPTFNRVEFLAPALESVLAQTFCDWELIIADDGSDEATRAYLQCIAAPPRIRVIWLQHCGRPGAVRNAALREARGEFIAFLDSDDLWLPQKLQLQIASLRRRASRRWSYTRFTLVDATGRPSSPRNVKHWAAPDGWIMEKILTEETVIALPSVIVSRQFLEAQAGFDEELVMCEDDELWLRLATHSEIDSIDEPLTLVRRHGQHSGSDVTAWRDRGRVFEKALRAGVESRHQAMLRRLRAQMACGLARSQAASGGRLSVLGTLFSSVPYSWRYGTWWRSALLAAARAFTPGLVRGAVRRYRHRQIAHHGQLRP